MQEHHFAHFLRILGKGRQGSRDLTREEAHDAVTLLLQGQAMDVQIGAFLMLLRVKDESADELAGMLQASRALSSPLDLDCTVDWPSYAGKRKHLPWFLLAAKRLSQEGIRIFMHGSPVGEDRLATRDVLRGLGIAHASDAASARKHLQQQRLVYMDLSDFHPRLSQLIALRPLLGVRTPMHSLVRLLNPSKAQLALVPIFHPAYRSRHLAALLAAGDQQVTIFKGEGGEAERNPDGVLKTEGLWLGVPYEETWPQMSSERHPMESMTDVNHLIALWRGDLDHPYGALACIGTMALVLRSLDPNKIMETALQQAQQLWDERDRHALQA
ncbi:MAG: glycosyl transferase family protein [Pseudomonadales bacterium]|nr:glycosyl transferase family protein [Pseudomonadales bacterium]